MLEFLRKAVKSWVAKGLLALLILSFAVWGISDVFSFTLTSAVATVGDQKVSADEYANALQRQRNALSQAQRRAVSLTEMRDSGFAQLVLARMIRDKAIAEELAQLGISAPDEAIAEAIRANEAFRGSGGGFSQANYRISLGQLGYSPAQYEELTRTLLGQQILEDASLGRAGPPPGLAARIALYQGERRSVDTVILPTSAVEAPPLPSDTELEAFYADNLGNYSEPERRSGVYVHVDASALLENATPTEEEVTAFYEANREQFARPETRTIDQLPIGTADGAALRRRLDDGETDWAALAAELGETPADLDLGTVQRNDLPDTVADAVFEATEPGILGPVEAPIGSVLIRVRGVELGGVPSLDDLRAPLTEELARRAVQERAPEIANQVDDLRAEGRTIPEIAEATGLPLGQFEGLAIDGTLAGGGVAIGISAEDVFLREVFDALDLEERDIVETPDGSFFLAMVETIAESRVLDFEEVRDRVATDWQRAQRVEVLLAEAEALASDLAGEATLSDLADERGLLLSDYPTFSREAPPTDLPFGMSERLFEVDEGSAVAMALPGGEGVMLSEVTEATLPEPDALQEITERIENALTRQYLEDDSELFARAIEASHPRHIDGSAVDGVFNLLGAPQHGGY
ncbi:MAG: SurA N-terminal domain-containing protein [Pseudomonadota bacterium]